MESNKKHLQKLREIMRPRKRLRSDLQYADPDPNAADSDNGDVEIEERTKEAIQKKMPPVKRESHKHHPQEKLDAPIETQEDKLIFTRVLGHFEIPHSHRWTETKNCWYCEQHVYTVVLASKHICQSFMLKPHGKDKKRLKDKITKNFKAHRKEFKNNNQLEYGSDCDEIYYDDEAETNDIINKQVSSPKKLKK